MIPYGRQDIQPADIDAVIEVLQSDFLTQGPQVPAFETRIATLCDVPYALAMSSATAALHLACLALEVGPGDWVWTVPNTFVASANCALYCQAQIDFVDIDITTGMLCPAALEQKLKTAAQQNRLPKVIIPVHFGGASAPMQQIAELVRPYDIKIIEDASHAIGGTYLAQPIGQAIYSDFCVFSFHPVKIVTTAEGGVLTTQDTQLAKQIELLRSHGITREPELMQKENPEPWYYEQQALGLNYRMTELQAALGKSQLTRLNQYVTRRNELAARYKAAFSGTPISYLEVPQGCYSAYHLFVIQVPAELRETLFKQMRAAGIGVNVHYIPVHWQPYYQALGFYKGQFPQAEQYYQQAITLPLHPRLTEAQQDFIVKRLFSLLP